MTRDEAERIARRGYAADSAMVLSAAGFIELCEKLGMLKLDEPKSGHQRALDVLYGAHAKGENISTPWNMVTILENAGLKIVEK